MLRLEDYSMSKFPGNFQRYSKILLSLSSLRSISVELTQELEVKRAMQSMDLAGDIFTTFDI